MMVLPPCGWSTLCGAVVQVVLSLLSLLHLCIYQTVLLSQTVNAQECITPNVTPFVITELLKKEMSAKMFYQCYTSPSQTQHLQLTINSLKFHGSGEEMMVYTDATPKVFNTDCGGCSKPKAVVNNSFHLTNFLSSFINDNSEGGEVTELANLGNEECHTCDTVLNGSFFEIYLRVSSNILCETDDIEECQSNIPEYNMTFSLVDKTSESPQVEASGCDDGQLVSFPLGSESCVVNVSSPNMIKQQCLLNTCSKENVSPESINEKTEHKFLPSVKSEFCVWELDTQQKKHIFLEFSKDVKPHITIFEHTLSEPVRNLEWCPIFRKNQFQMETKADKVFIVYNRQERLDGKGSISIRLQADLCPLPPPINHGTVEFLRKETGTKAFYRCDNGFEILGKTEVLCTNEAWDDTPVCLPTEKDKLMSDEPVESIENVVSTVIENVNSTVNDTDSMLLSIKNEPTDSLLSAIKNDSVATVADTEMVRHQGSKMSLGIGQNDYAHEDEEDLEVELREEISHADEELNEKDAHDEEEKLKIKLDENFKEDKAEKNVNIVSQHPTVTPLEEDIIKEEADISNIAIQSGNINEKEDETQTMSDNKNDSESDGTRVRIDSVDEDSEIKVLGGVDEESPLQENTTSGIGDVNSENGGFSLEILNFKLEEEMLYYVIGGAAVLLLIVIISCISCCCVYRKGKLGIGRKFDTFQNPIYEKTVVRMPMKPPETVVEIEREKMDLEEISDCTVLE